MDVPFPIIALIAIAAAQNQITTGGTALSGLGSCRMQNGIVDLRRVAFLENRSIDQDSPSGPVRISVSGESVDIESFGEGSNHHIVVHNIGYELSHSEDIDIDLKLAIFEGRLVVYWRETFQHRSHRQGLFAVTPPSLTPLCEGRGGFDSDD